MEEWKAALTAACASCDYFYKIRIPQQIRKQLLVQLDAMGFHESSIYPDMEHIAKEQADSHFNF